MLILRFHALALAGLLVLSTGHVAGAADEPPDEGTSSQAADHEPQAGSLDMKKVNNVRRLAAAGYTFMAIGIGAMVGSWIAYVPHIGAKVDSLPPVWFVLISSWGATAAIGVPMLQVASFKARKLLGLPPVDGFFIAGWIFFGLNFAAIAFMEANPIYSMLYATIGFTAAMLWSWWGAGRSMRRLRRAERASLESGATVIPWVTALPGGAMAGIAGTF